MDIAAAVQAVVDTLDAAGVAAVIDARDANPPCVQVRPPVVTYRFGKNCWDADYTAWAMVGDAGMAANLHAQSALVEAVQAALGVVVTARPDDALMPDGSTLPIYVLTWSARIT